MPHPLNVYLCTDEVSSASQVLSRKYAEKVEIGNLTWSEATIDGFEEVKFLKLQRLVSQPRWTEFLEIYFPVVEELTNSSEGGVLFLKCHDRYFVIPFGNGAFALDDRKLESDFGLMVTVNEVDEASLRFLDSNNPSAGMKSRYQADRLSALGSFDIDTALTFIKRLGGKSSGTFGKSLSGAAGFKFSGPDDLSLLPPILGNLAERYEAESYKEKGLDFVRSMKAIRKPSLIGDLDVLAVQKIRDGSSDFVLCSPVIIEQDRFGLFKFGGFYSKEEFEDLDLDSYISALNAAAYGSINDEATFLTDMKTSHTVRVVDPETNAIRKSWNVYRCLQGSVLFANERYTLDDGKWLHVSEQFRESVEETYSSIRTHADDDAFPPAKIVEFDKDGKVKRGVEPEGDYNKRVAEELSIIYLDKETGSVPGVANQRNELCDLLIKDGTCRLVHVKKGSRTSGPLHHLFRQGATAARMLRDPMFLNTISQKLRTQGKDDDAALVDELWDKRNIIEFRVIDKKRKSGGFDIPFFAKVALHYAVREIRASGADVRLGFIEQEG